MKLTFYIIIMATLQKYVVQGTLMRNRCRYEARMLSLNRTLTTERQRYTDTVRHQRIEDRFHRTQVKHRTCNKFSTSRQKMADTLNARKLSRK